MYISSGAGVGGTELNISCSRISLEFSHITSFVHPTAVEQYPCELLPEMNGDDSSTDKEY